MPIQHTDAFQLMKFAAAMRPHAHLDNKAIQVHVLKHGTPVLAQLRANGHDLNTAIDLLRTTLKDLQKG